LPTGTRRGTKDPWLASILILNIREIVPSKLPTRQFTMSQPQPLGPFKLVTVNTAPERARKIIGRVVEAVKDKYTIIHAANVEGEQLRFQ
jgi:hypothetical protein